MSGERKGSGGSEDAFVLLSNVFLLDELDHRSGLLDGAGDFSRLLNESKNSGGYGDVDMVGKELNLLQDDVVVIGHLDPLDIVVASAEGDEKERGGLSPDRYRAFQKYRHHFHLSLCAHRRRTAGQQQHLKVSILNMEFTFYILFFKNRPRSESSGNRSDHLS